jgi:hypothetical protein
VYEAITLYCRASHPVPLRRIISTSQPYNPNIAVTILVWALSLSLATTQEIIVIFSSSAYLDVSVRRVRSFVTGLQPAGLPHSEIRGSIHICQSPRLIAAYHVLHRLREPRHSPCTLYYFLLLMRLLRRMVCFFALAMMSHTFPRINPWASEHKHSSRLLLFALLF